ncbi:MAG: hypothetical protein R2713_02245 [Ilumatobacteraceae bacterium]
MRVEPAFDASRDRDVDLVIVGPESALVAGTADACAAAGVACFGPSVARAPRSSKGFTARSPTNSASRRRRSSAPTARTAR